MFSRSNHHDLAGASAPTAPSTLCYTSSSYLEPPSTHHQHLEALLDSALATLVLIHETTSGPIAHSPRVTDVLRVLTRRIIATSTSATTPAPDSAPTPPPLLVPERAPDTAATYAHALSAESSQPPKDNIPKHCPILPTPSPSPPPSSRPPQHRRPDSEIPDVILCLDLLPQSVSHRCSEGKLLITASDALEKAIGAVPAISGVRWTRNGNLALQVDLDGGSSKTIAAHASVIWAAIRPLLGFTEQQRQPRFNEGNPWRAVVFHAVPVGPKSKKQFTLSSVRSWLGLDGPTSPVRAVSVLCRNEDFAGKQYVSLRISMDSDTESQRLVTEGGLLFGTWCRASHYAARPRSVDPREPPTHTYPSPLVGR
ncbi:hypothetical protein C8J57DRAFT_1660518 [Mycena rebaudengoi]|nr:hypothetical protein C8J57DRAFT_1660518 [Mycena rebaudengoi]